MEYKVFDSIEAIKKVVGSGNSLVVIEQNQAMNVGFVDILKRKHQGSFTAEQVKDSYGEHPIEYTKVLLDGLGIYIFSESNVKVKFGNVFKHFTNSLNHSGVFELFKTYTSDKGSVYDIVGVIYV